jgi:Family of unknown function (DUF5681)
MNETNEIEDHLEDMCEDTKTEDYEVGYGKPPEDRQFKKGISGNPSGRPKKPLDSVSVLMRVLHSKVTINEKGKQKVITKLEGMWKQAVNRALSGDPKAIDLVAKWCLQEQGTAAELHQRSQNDLNRKTKAKDFSDEELTSMLRASLKKNRPK